MKKPSGTMIGISRPASFCGSATSRAPPKWSMCEWVKMTPVTGRSSTCLRSSASPAAAVSVDISGSTTIQPVSPAMKVTLDTSKARTW